MKTILGTDICLIEGISEVTIVDLVSEVGTDMNKWSNTKHFSAWLNVSPNTKISGGKVISSKMAKKKNRAGQALRMAASGLSQSKAPIGDYARKMRARLGKKGGVVATAHKLSRVIYVLIKNKSEYNNEFMLREREKLKDFKILQLEKRLDALKQSKALSA